MKMYKKENLIYKDGYLLTKKGKVVGVDNEVVDLFNKLEDDIQLAQYHRDREARIECAEKEVAKRFSRKSEYYKTALFTAETPELDKLYEKTEKIMDEIDDMSAAQAATEYMLHISPVIQFIHAENVISCEQGTQHRFDLPTIGNPLEVTPGQLGELVLGMYAE